LARPQKFPGLLPDPIKTSLDPECIAKTFRKKPRRDGIRPKKLD
jgi:hypothetical protein